MRNTADVTGGKPIDVLLQSISGVSAINPLVAVYDIHGGKREVLFFYLVPDTTRDETPLYYVMIILHLKNSIKVDDVSSLISFYLNTSLDLKCLCIN
jgi:hypothetical protein